MTAATIDQPGSPAPALRAQDRFAARRALAAANADVSVSENQALFRAAAESLAARRRRDSPRPS